MCYIGIIKKCTRAPEHSGALLFAGGGLSIVTADAKRRCVQLSKNGTKYKDIYNEIVKPNSEMTFRTFARRMAEWKSRYDTGEEMLDAANIAYKFTPKASTVQVNAKGEVERAWIKQTTEDRWEEILTAVKDSTPVCKINPRPNDSAKGMLEIPLFDMHFGIADLEHYKETLEDILGIVTMRHWDMIVIPVGQDLFHNDSIANGITTKGTQIERVDLQKAVHDAQAFYFNLIDTAIEHANEVKVIYSPGNHDRTVGWLFSVILKTRYGSIVDDSCKMRKAVWWEGCFIGITHGEKKSDTASGLRGKFTEEFPVLFATSKVREIHCGHLHREDASKDEYAMLIRRLCSGNKEDEWSEGEGYKSIKRFMLFEWMPGRLKSIHYV